MRVLFAHGFEGSPSGSKPTYMRDVLGWDVVAPVMSRRGWSVAHQAEVVVEHLKHDSFDLVMGSSMGGLAVANASAQEPQIAIHVLLIAPAFGLASHWAQRLGAAALKQWRERDELHYRGFGLHVKLPWAFYEDAQRMSWPVPTHPTTVLHGTEDDVVPIEAARQLVEMTTSVHLREIQDGHRMKSCLPLLDEVAKALLAR